MKKLPLLAISGALLLLPACSAQNYAGITMAEAHFNDNNQLESILVVDGKESAEKNWSVNLRTGKVEYSSSDVKAFEGQKVRNQVFQTLMSEVPEAAGILTDKIMKIVNP